MKEHEQIMGEIHAIVDEMGDVDRVSTDAVANRLLHRFGGDDLDARLAYASLEHLKQMTRRAFGRAFDKPTALDVISQGDLFSSKLQTRYPVPTKPGEERVYVRLEVMTSEERRWNADRLLKAGRAFTMHGKALLAYDDAHASASPANDAEARGAAA